MDDERARRLVARLLAMSRGAEYERALTTLALLDEHADAAIDEAGAAHLRHDLARHRAAAMTHAELALAIADGADLEPLPLSDELYRYLADREDDVTADAIDRLCKRDRFTHDWFAEHAAERLRAHAIARASHGDAYWFDTAARGGGRATVARFVDEPAAMRVLAELGDHEAVARQVRDEASVLALCATIAAARRRGDAETLAVAEPALARILPADDLTALCAAAEVGCLAAIDPLVERLPADASRIVPKLAALAAAVTVPARERARLVDAVEIALAARGVHVVAAGFELAARLGEDVVPSIVGTCRRTDARDFAAARLAACKAIGRPVREALEAVLLGDRDPEVRANAAVLIGDLGDPASVPAVAAAVGDPEAAVRMAALGSLVQVARPRPTEDALAAYIRATEDADPEVRVRAAQALGGNRDPRAVEALRRSYATADAATKPRLRRFIPR